MSTELIKDAYALKDGYVYALQCDRYLTPEEKQDLSDELVRVKQGRNIEFVLLPPGVSLAEVREEASMDLRTL